MRTVCTIIFAGLALIVSSACKHHHEGKSSTKFLGIEHDHRSNSGLDPRFAIRQLSSGLKVYINIQASEISEPQARAYVNHAVQEWTEAIRKGHPEATIAALAWVPNPSDAHITVNFFAEAGRSHIMAGETGQSRYIINLLPKYLTDVIAEYGEDFLSPVDIRVLNGGLVYLMGSMVHELGHAFGLGDLYDTDMPGTKHRIGLQPRSVMSESYYYGKIGGLSEDDEDGIAWIYANYVVAGRNDLPGCPDGYIEQVTLHPDQTGLAEARGCIKDEIDETQLASLCEQRGGNYVNGKYNCLCPLDDEPRAPFPYLFGGICDQKERSIPVKHPKQGQLHCVFNDGTTNYHRIDRIKVKFRNSRSAIVRFVKGPATEAAADGSSPEVRLPVAAAYKILRAKEKWQSSIYPGRLRELMMTIKNKGALGATPKWKPVVCAFRRKP